MRGGSILRNSQRKCFEANDVKRGELKAQRGIGEA
jgi:hypothetical protein